MSDAPICKVCNNTTVLVDIGILNSISYWYCRPCKLEVKRDGSPVLVFKAPKKVEETPKERKENFGPYTPASEKAEPTQEKDQLSEEELDELQKYIDKWGDEDYDLDGDPLYRAFTSTD